MFLKSEAADAVARVNKKKEDYDNSVKYLQESCLGRYEVCCSIRDTITVRYRKMLDAISVAMQKETTAKIENLNKEVQCVETMLSNSVACFVKDLDIVKETYDNMTATGSAAAGAAAGAAMAVMGPTALMATATTFGVASTGTAISAFSGAAATNAALAWIGGGALAAGGGGTALGGTVLALAGPIGWSIAAVSIAGGSFFYRRKNKETIEKAQRAEKEIVDAAIKVEKNTKTINEGVKLNKSRFVSAHKLLGELADDITENGLTDKNIEECQVAIETVKQLAHYMSDRIVLEQ